MCLLYIIFNKLMSDLRMYILVNKDLKMGVGKICAQVSHAVGMITDEILTSYYESSEKKSIIHENYKIWKRTGHKKIVLKVSENELKKYVDSENSVFVIDAGHTQIPEGSLTVVGFYPSEKDVRFENYKLL